MIGVFDSGVGGLSVWKELFREMPGEKFLYLSDGGFCPYGPKSKDEIIGRAVKITDYLISNGAEIIVVACNTATAAAISYLRSHYSTPFVGMEPAVKPAAINTKSGAIGVLATKGTFKGELYLRTLHKFASNAKVIEQVGEGLVELVESGNTNTQEARELIGRYVVPMIEENVDHIVLGCTHYPFLEQLIEEVAGKEVTIVNPAPAVAKRAKDVLGQVRLKYHRKDIETGESKISRFVTTGTNISLMKKMVEDIVPGYDAEFEIINI